MTTPSIPSEASILIIGAGPAGLALACTLLNKGVAPSSVLIVERASLAYKQARHNQSRALSINARTLECLEEGVDDPLAPSPRPPTGEEPSAALAGDEIVKSTVQSILNRARIVDRMVIRQPQSQKPLLTSPLNLLKGETRYPFIVVHPQASTESILQFRFETLGGTLHREWSFESSETVEERSIGKPLKVKLVHSSGACAEVQTKILVGSDGGHSKVRACTGIDFSGYTYSETFLLGDVKFKSPKWPYFTEEGWNGYEGSQIISQAGWLLLIPLPGGFVRMVVDEAQFVADAEATKALRSSGHLEDRKAPTQAELQEVLIKRGPKTEVEDGRNTITEVAWTSRFHIAHRIVPTFIKGPVCLIGDAAHVHSPAGGQGLNTGIQDGISLGLILSGFFQPSSTLSEAASLSLSEKLKAWSVKRHAVAEKVLSISNRLTRIITVKNPLLIWLRAQLYRIMGLFPSLLKISMRAVMGLNYR